MSRGGLGVAAVPQLQGRPSSVGEYNNRNQFQLVKELHSSNFGTVHLAKVREPRSRGGPSKVILKRRNVPELGKAKDMLNEYEVMKQLKHPNIIQCYGYFWDEDTQSVYLVLEYAQCGDLHAELQARRKGLRHFSDAEVCDILSQLVAGLSHMHSKGIVHRDIKSLNLLLTDSGMVKLGDFGVSRQMSDNTLYLNSFYGTPLYLSPELIEGKPYSDTTDVWSLGVVLYEILALQPPFGGRCLQDVVNTVLRGRYSPLPATRPAEFTSLVSDMLTKEAHRRPRIGAVAQKLLRVQKLYGGKPETAASSDSGGRGCVRGSGGSDWRPASTASLAIDSKGGGTVVDCCDADGRGPLQAYQDAEPAGRRSASVPASRGWSASSSGRAQRAAGAHQQPQSQACHGIGQDDGRGSIVEVVRGRRKSGAGCIESVPSPAAQEHARALPPQARTPDAHRAASTEQWIVQHQAEQELPVGAPSTPARNEPQPQRQAAASMREMRWEERRRAHEERQGQQVPRSGHREGSQQPGPPYPQSAPAAPPGAGPPRMPPGAASAPPRQGAAGRQSAPAPAGYAGCPNGGCACAYPSRQDSPNARAAAAAGYPSTPTGAGQRRSPMYDFQGWPDAQAKAFGYGGGQPPADGLRQGGGAVRRAASQGAPSGMAAGHHPHGGMPQQDKPLHSRKAAAGGGVPPWQRYDIVGNRWMDN